MLIPNHPDDERLAALAAGDPDVADDHALVQHVADCARCSGVISDLELLRVELAELPDVAPSRPLRLLPEVAEPRRSPVDRAGGWVRRLFTPALAAGAALAMVGLVGTTAPALDQMASSGADGSGQTLEHAPADGAAEGDFGGDDRSISTEDAGAPAPAGGEDEGDAAAAGGVDEDASRSAPGGELPAERSPWPMVLFTGIAVVVGALLLRWILAPPAG